MNTNKLSNYNVPFNYAKNKLKLLNPNDITSLSNVEFNQNHSQFLINICNTAYNVSYPNGEVFDSNGELSTYLDTNILIIRYLINSKGVPITNKFITFKEVPGGNVYYSNFLNRTIKRLSTEFNSCIEKYKIVMENMTAEKMDIGDLSYKFKFIGNTYIIFVLYFGDDEFEPNANILFDSNIIYYFNAEDLAVVPDVAMDIIKSKISNL